MITDYAMIFTVPSVDAVIVLASSVHLCFNPPVSLSRPKDLGVSMGIVRYMKDAMQEYDYERIYCEMYSKHMRFRGTFSVWFLTQYIKRSIYRSVLFSDKI